MAMGCDGFCYQKGVIMSGPLDQYGVGKVPPAC